MKSEKKNNKLRNSSLPYLPFTLIPKNNCTHSLPLMRIPAHFTIISPTPNTSLSAQLDETERLLAAWLADNGLRGNQLIQARFYLTDAANSLSLLETHSLYNATCAHCARSWP